MELILQNINMIVIEQIRLKIRGFKRLVVVYAKLIL